MYFLNNIKINVKCKINIFEIIFLIRKEEFVVFFVVNIYKYKFIKELGEVLYKN